MRTIVDLPEEQVKRLDSFCRHARISRAEAVRRAVARFLERIGRPGRPDAAFGVWKGRFSDGLAYQRRVRREWD